SGAARDHEPAGHGARAGEGRRHRKAAARRRPGRADADEGEQEPDRLARQQALDAAESLPLFRVHAVVVLQPRPAVPGEAEPMDLAPGRGGYHNAADDPAATAARHSAAPADLA